MDKEFVEDVKTELGFLAKGRMARVAGESYQLREPSATYKSHSGVENGVIGVENCYCWGRDGRRKKSKVGPTPEVKNSK